MVFIHFHLAKILLKCRFSNTSFWYCSEMASFFLLLNLKAKLTKWFKQYKLKTITQTEYLVKMVFLWILTAYYPDHSKYLENLFYLQGTCQNCFSLNPDSSLFRPFQVLCFKNLWYLQGTWDNHMRSWQIELNINAILSVELIHETDSSWVLSGCSSAGGKSVFVVFLNCMLPKQTKPPCVFWLVKP